MQWTDVSEAARSQLMELGGFTPTINSHHRELKGYLHSEVDGRTYFCSADLRKISATCIEAADWLDKRAELAEQNEELK